MLLNDCLYSIFSDDVTRQKLFSITREDIAAIEVVINNCNTEFKLVGDYLKNYVTNETYPATIDMLPLWNNQTCPIDLEVDGDAHMMNLNYQHDDVLTHIQSDIDISTIDIVCRRSCLRDIMNFVTNNIDSSTCIDLYATIARNCNMVYLSNSQKYGVNPIPHAFGFSFENKFTTSIENTEYYHIYKCQLGLLNILINCEIDCVEYDSNTKQHIPIELKCISINKNITLLQKEQFYWQMFFSNINKCKIGRHRKNNINNNITTVERVETYHINELITNKNYQIKLLYKFINILQQVIYAIRDINCQSNNNVTKENNQFDDHNMLNLHICMTSRGLNISYCNHKHKSNIPLLFRDNSPKIPHTIQK